MKIAILGWGSLVWDPDSLCRLCGPWFNPGGPKLPIEFSRVSKDGRLTLVIDRDNGVAAPTRVATSTRSNLNDAVTDVWIREMRFPGERSIAQQRSKDGRIGYRDLRGENASVNLPKDKLHPDHQDHQFAHDLIMPWLETSGFDAVVWTALPSNYKEITGRDFSVKEAVKYLEKLPATSSPEKASHEDALEYIGRAPDEVETPLRTRLRELELNVIPQERTRTRTFEPVLTSTPEPTPPMTPRPSDVIGDEHVTEALGFLKDWVTALIAIDTAAIGVLAAFLPQVRDYHHWQRWLLGLTLFCLGFSILCGCTVLYMLPGCAQRRPNRDKDIYSLRSIDRSLGFWARWFWRGFMASVISILSFYASRMGSDFLAVAIAVVVVAFLMRSALPNLPFTKNRWEKVMQTLEKD